MAECVIFNVKIHIEIPLLLLFFSYTFFDSVRTNLIIYRTCYVTLGYNESECALLGSKNKDNHTAELEKLVEPHAAVITMTQSLTEGCISAIICLFVGPWSDKFGRKPLLIMPQIGFTTFYVLYAIFASLGHISPWYCLICSIPVYLSGGGSSFLTALLCYITDVTTERNRGMRMGIFEGLLAVGIFIGNISSSYVFAATGYVAVFLISALCVFLGLVFTVFFIPESLANPVTDGNLRELFQFTHIKEMLKTTFRRRDNNDRFIVLCCITMLTIYLVAVNGDGSVSFLFVREKFHWSLQQYTLYNAAHNVTYVVGTVIGIYVLHKMLKIPESVMIVIGFASLMIGMLITGLAQTNWEVYAGALTRSSLSGILSPMVRSLVSKVVPNDEVGKIFALIVASESLIGLGGQPIYTAIYNATISIDPAIFNFVSAGIYAVEVLLAVIVIFKRTPRGTELGYDEIINEENSEERSLINGHVAT